MKGHRIIFALFIITLLWIPLICSGCSSEEYEGLNGSTRGNSDGNINNLGLSVQNGDTLYYVGTENEYDLIYEADLSGEPQKALTGLTGYIQFLNVADQTLYFLGITYDDAEQRSESIFSADLNGENKTCLYTIKAGESTSYLNALGGLLIYAAADEKGRTRVCAINPQDRTEAELFSEKETIHSLLIDGERFYYITDNRICSIRVDGTDKKTIYESEEWIGNMVLLENALYFTKSHDDDIGHHDAICRVNQNGEDFEELFTEGKWIGAMNGEGQILCFADNTNDSEGNLKEAVFYALNTEKAEITELGRTQQEYTGMEICGDLLICHLADEHLTTQIIKLP